MIPKMADNKNWSLLRFLMMLTLGLASFVGTFPAAAQQNQPDQPREVQGNVPPPDSQTQGQAGAPAEPQPATQPQGQPDAQAQGQPSQAVLPQTLTMPAGTIVRVRVDEWISTDRNVTGDSFGAVLDQPIVVDGWVVARRGQAQTGRVSLVKKGGHGTGLLSLESIYPS